MYLPNLEELSFLMVVALPKASKSGLLSTMRCTMRDVSSDVVVLEEDSDEMLAK